MLPGVGQVITGVAFAMLSCAEPLLLMKPVPDGVYVACIVYDPAFVPAGIASTALALPLFTAPGTDEPNRVNVTVPPLSGTPPPETVALTLTDWAFGLKVAEDAATDVVVDVELAGLNVFNAIARVPKGCPKPGPSSVTCPMMAPSGLPSPLKSATATARGFGPDGIETSGLNVPSPLPCRKDPSAAPQQSVSNTSRFPSPSTSATAMEGGWVMVGWEEGA